MKLLICVLAVSLAAVAQAQGRCPEGQYYTGYECRDKTIGQSELCPLVASSPPPSGSARCVNGGSNFWYIHVGGRRTDWTEGTDAMCLSTASLPAAWGAYHCQFAWSEDGCLEVLQHAGCIPTADGTGDLEKDDYPTPEEMSPSEESDESALSSEEGRCQEREYFTGYGCREKTIGQSDFCPIVASSPPPRGEVRCVNGGDNFWYIRVGGQRADWTRGTDAQCLSTSALPAVWGRDPCQFAWNEQGCLEILENAGCDSAPHDEDWDEESDGHSDESDKSSDESDRSSWSSEEDDEPLVRCKRPMCKMFCELGFQTDEQGCPTCHCLPNPCDAIRCGGGEMCEPKKCDFHPCTGLVGACVPQPEPEHERPMPCAVPMCSNPCPYGYAKNEYGCDSCKCNAAKPLCHHVREAQDEKKGREPFDFFRVGKMDPEVVRDMKKKFAALNGPQCEKNGTFVPRQCSPMNGSCWCVDDRGAEIPNTRQAVDEYDVEEDLPQCVRNSTTAIHMTFKMVHKIPTEDLPRHLPLLKDTVHAHLSRWLMIRKEFIEIIAVRPDLIIEHVIIVEFIVERDGNTDLDLPSAAQSMHRDMRDGKLKMPYKDTVLTPQPETLTMRHQFDRPALPAQGLHDSESTVGWACHRARKFYRHHRVLTILAAVGGVVLLATITGVTISQCCKKRRSASMQFSHKRLETMNNFKHNLVLDFENHPDLVGEKKEKLTDDPILVSSVSLDDEEKKVSLA